MFIILNVDYLHSTEVVIPIIDTSVFISLHFPSSSSTTSVEKTSPLIDYYEKQGVVYHINGNNGKEETHRQVVEILGE